MCAIVVVDGDVNLATNFSSKLLLSSSAGVVWLPQCLLASQPAAAVSFDSTRLHCLCALSVVRARERIVCAHTKLR